MIACFIDWDGLTQLVSLPYESAHLKLEIHALALGPSGNFLIC